MANNPLASKQPPVHLGKQLLVAAILLVVVGIVIIIIGKFIVGGVLALFGAIFGLSAQVMRDTEL